MQFSSRDFSYDKATGTFAAEISSLSRGGKLNIWHRAFDDACDQGIDIVSARTGRTVSYVLLDTLKDREGDAVCWELIPVRGSVREASLTRVMIYND